MSRQYLKELKYRAQQLLEASSEEEEEVNAYTATQRDARSPARIDLDDELYNNHPSEDYPDQHSPRSTDIELLKKCISLTTENNHLQILVDKQQTEINHFQVLIRQHSSTEEELKRVIEFSLKTAQDREPDMSGELADLQKDITQFKVEKQMMKKESERLERERVDFTREKADFTREKEQFLLDRSGKSLHLSPSSSPPHISTQHDYTIKTQKQQAVPLQDKIDLHEYQLRIKRLEAMLREQRSKVGKFCHFINSEIPKLKDTIVELTTKLDLKVDKYLLRDVSY